MLDFRPDEEQRMLTEAIHRFAEEKVRKAFREAEETGRIPPEVVQAGWDIGLLPTGLPEAFGGFGEYSTLTNALAVEEFAWGDLALTLNILLPNLVALPLHLCGTEDQKAEYLPRFCEAAPPAVTAALTEPVFRFDPRRLQTTAERDGDSYLLQGVKTMVPLAPEADLFLIYAREGERTQAFLVPAGTAGLQVGEPVKLMGMNALQTYRVSLDRCRVPVGAKVGGEQGLDFDLVLNHGRIALGAAAVGLMRAGFEFARDYAKQRVQFGRPIAQNQSIAFMLAEMATDINQARLMVWEAAWKLDRGEAATRETTVMKYHLDDLAVKVADQAVQILGGYGYIREYPVELWLRNARGIAHLDGLAMV